MTKNAEKWRIFCVLPIVHSACSLTANAMFVHFVTIDSTWLSFSKHTCFAFLFAIFRSSQIFHVYTFFLIFLFSHAFISLNTRVWVIRVNKLKMYFSCKKLLLLHNLLLTCDSSIFEWNSYMKEYKKNISINLHICEVIKAVK